jgi:hypothetical protein
VRQNKIDCFEHLRSDLDECEYLIRSECVFLIERRSDEFQLMKIVIEMPEMMMKMIIELTMIIELMMTELKVIVICSFEIACLETICRMLF